MLKPGLLICFAILLVSPLPAQASDDAVAEPARVSAARLSFDVQLTEYKFDQPLDPSLSTQAIVEMLAKPAADADYEVVTSRRLSVDNEIEALVQTGQTVRLTTGTTQTPRGVSRNTKEYHVGKITRVIVASRVDGVLVNLDYTSSGVDEDRSEDQLPLIEKTTVQVTKTIELGKPALLGSSRDSVILVTVTAAQ